LPYINITFLFHSDSQLISYHTYVCPATGANIPSIQSSLNLVNLLGFFWQKILARRSFNNQANHSNSSSRSQSPFWDAFNCLIATFKTNCFYSSFQRSMVCCCHLRRSYQAHPSKFESIFFSVLKRYCMGREH
jgi:hypothetical protein